MTMNQLNNNILNRTFEHMIDRTLSGISSRMKNTCGYSSAILLDRLMQRVTEITLPKYAAAVGEKYKPTGEICFNEGENVNCDLANIEPNTGEVSFTTKQWISNQSGFLAHWLLCLFSIIVVKKNSKGNSPTVLVFGVGLYSLFGKDDDEQFVTYCRNGPIDPLRDASRVLVEALRQENSMIDGGFFYLKRPLITLIREARIGFWRRSWLLLKHVALFFAYLSAVLRLPHLSLIGKDLAYSSIMFELDRCKLIDAVIFTNVYAGSQPLWSRVLHNGRTHMVWYSQNHKPVSYNFDNLDSDHPSMRWLRVNAHWVWTSSFANYLRSFDHGGTVNVIGPIMFYLPVRTLPESSSIKIFIFDNPPFSDDLALKHGQVSNYNHPDNMFIFIRGVIALKCELEKYFGKSVAFHLKTKRGYNINYDRGYFDYIEDLDAKGVITIEHHSVNMYSLISGANLVIVYPFSTPAYMADYLDVPSIYYDPTGSIIRSDFSDTPSLMTFAGTPESLLSSAILALKKVFDKAVET
jgi:hypothetical protein